MSTNNQGPLPIELENYMKSIIYTIEHDYPKYLPQVTSFITSVSKVLDEKKEKSPEKKSNPLNLIIGPRSIYDNKLPLKQFGGICIGVGGVKGVLQAGAIHEFWTRGQLKNLTYYSGSSVGAMIATLLCVGYEPLDLLTSQCAPDFAGQFDALNFMNLPSIFGFYPSSILRTKIEQMIMFKLGYLPTFSDIVTKLHKHLIIPVYCISETKIEDRKIYCSPENTPNMSVIEAVILSCSIPFIFQKNTYQDKVYLDGAYTSVVPINALEKTAPADCDLLCICLKDDELNLNSFLGYISSIIMIPLQEQSVLNNLSSRTSVIEICSETQISSINFTINSTQKMNLFSYGSKQVRELLQLLGKNICSSQAKKTKDKNE